MSAWGRSSTPTVAVDHVPTIAAAAVPVNNTIISDTAAPPVVAPATNTNPTAAPHIYEEIRGQANPPLSLRPPIYFTIIGEAIIYVGVQVDRRRACLPTECLVYMWGGSSRGGDRATAAMHGG